MTLISSGQRQSRRSPPIVPLTYASRRAQMGIGAHFAEADLAGTCSYRVRFSPPTSRLQHPSAGLMPLLDDPSAEAGRERQGLNLGTIRRPTTGTRHPSGHIRHGPSLDRVATTLRELQRGSGLGPRALRDAAISGGESVSWLPHH